jgi:protein involved in polysaccharide export with SLBB domain
VIRPFGFDFFAGAPGEVAPPQAVPEDYHLGRGDRIRVRYWTPLVPDVTHEVVVNAAGVLPIPEIGDVPATGLTLPEFRERLLARVREQFKNPSVAADLIETRTISVFVAGAARRPGRYTVNALTGLFNVIYAAGGPTEEGSLRRVTLRRQNQALVSMDVYKFLLDGITDTDLVLQDGDTIVFPVAGPRVTIRGQVARPAIYEILDGTTIADIAALAGGLRPSAYSRVLRLQRIEQGRRMERTLNAEAVLSNPRHPDNLVLRAGDEIDVENVTDQVSQRVTIRGHVAFPGTYSTLRTPTVKSLLTEAIVRSGAHWERADLMRGLADGTPVIVPVPLKPLL